MLWVMKLIKITLHIFAFVLERKYAYIYIYFISEKICTKQIDNSNYYKKSYNLVKNIYEFQCMIKIQRI